MSQEIINKIMARLRLLCKADEKKVLKWMGDRNEALGKEIPNSLLKAGKASLVYNYLRNCAHNEFDKDASIE